MCNAWPNSCGSAWKEGPHGYPTSSYGSWISVRGLESHPVLTDGQYLTLKFVSSASRESHLALTFDIMAWYGVSGKVFATANKNSALHQIAGEYKTRYPHASQ
eukprot:COSAG05_NODE_240_length_13119_cov_122.275806_4_plen_103_part_00